MSSSRSKRCVPASLLAWAAALLLALPVLSAPESVDLPALSLRARAVLDAAKRNDRVALRGMVEVRDPPWAEDPWALAHELILHGHRRAARALATASPRLDLRPLADYVRRLERRPPSPALWRQREALHRLAGEEDWYGVRKTADVAATGAEPATVPAVGIRQALASALEELGKPVEAMAMAREAARVAERMGWWSAAAESLDWAQGFADQLRDDAGMLEILERKLVVASRRGDQRKTAHALTNMATVQGRLGNYDAALSSYRQILARHADALRVADRAHIHVSTAMAEQNLGHIANAQREARRALDRAREACAEARRTKAKKSVCDEADALIASAQERLGVIAMEIGDYPEAERRLREAESTLRAIENPRYLAYVLQVVSNRGVLEIYRGNLDEAQRVMQSTLGAWEELERPIYAETARLNLAEIHRRRAESLKGEPRTKELAQAQKLLTRTLRSLRTLGSGETLCSALVESARVHGLLGEHGRALSDLDDALVLATEAASVYLETQVLGERAEAELRRGELALALAASKQAANGLSYLFDRLAPMQSALARSQTARLYEIGLACAAALGAKGKHLDDAFRFLEAGRAGALLTRLEGRSELRTQRIDAALVKLERSARKDEAAAYATLQMAHRSGKRQPVKDAQQALAAARLAHKDAIQRIQLEQGIAANLIYPEPAARRDIEAALAHDEALLLYGAAAGQAYALVMHSDGSRLVELGTQQAIHAACEALDVGAGPEGAAIDAKALRDLVVKPAALGKGIRRVFLSTSGCLSYEPPALLFPEREVCCVASGTTWLLSSKAAPVAGLGVLALGDPAYGPPPPGWSSPSAVRGGKLVRLPGSGEEAKAVGDVHLLREEASETHLRHVLANEHKIDGQVTRAWRALHLACHGLVDRRRPSESGLALASTQEDDGLLKSLDIAGLELAADLVVLSACDSGRGVELAGEGIVGFTSMFQIAGARRVMVSLWKVDDSATRELMIKFHQLWNAKDPKQRLSAAAALRAAQRHVRDYAKNHKGRHAEWAHPHYWAAWQLWGPAD